MNWIQAIEILALAFGVIGLMLVLIPDHFSTQPWDSVPAHIEQKPCPNPIHGKPAATGKEGK